MSDLQSVRLAALRREYHAALAAARNAEDVGDDAGRQLWEEKATVLLRSIAAATPAAKPTTKSGAKPNSKPTATH